MRSLTSCTWCNHERHQGARKQKGEENTNNALYYDLPQNRLDSLKANLCARRSGFPYVRNLRLNIWGLVDVDADYQ